ncbi:SDR family NAD(P)-dependent oxidoreductase [Leptolyngbya sp. 15MV]|nr:SDR family NAD(P)-dependent oxidoreductase [Leptolyngbya sp. 15MV]
MMGQFGETTSADEVLEGIDLARRTAFVTGGYSGLGEETARAMAARGASVILSGRDADKLADAAGRIAAATGATVGTLACDLASLASVRAAGEEANRRFERIDLLINNAGVMACPFARTADGFEMQFGTNHLGHFLLTVLLMPLVRKGSAQRIVNLSSRGHHIDRVHLDDPNYAAREYEKWAAYGQSKTANVLFAVGLERRLADEGIHACAVHPGGIQTNLGRHMDADDVAALLKRIVESTGEAPRFKTVPQGAATTCWAATAAELEGRGGFYAEDCHVAAVDDADRRGGVRTYAVDPATADALWALSEELVGQAFPL